MLLKNYARNKNMKTAITVGVVGFPNVGKSSLINSLKRSRSAAAVGNTPGMTKANKEIVLDKHVKLIDSPGVVFASSLGENAGVTALRNCVKVERLEDPHRARLRDPAPVPRRAAHARVQDQHVRGRGRFS